MPEDARFDEFPRLAVAGQHHVLRADLHETVRLRDRIGDAEGVFHLERHGLFDVDVLARSEGIDDVLGVPVFGGRDDHAVDVLLLQEFAVVAVAAHGEPLGLRRTVDPTVEVRFRDVRDRRHLHLLLVLLGEAHEGFDVAATHVADPDHRDAQRFVALDRHRCAYDGGFGHTGRIGGAARQRHGGETGGRVAEEVTTGGGRRNGVAG